MSVRSSRDHARKTVIDPGIVAGVLRELRGMPSGDLDLDTVDGEFYYRCCHPEVTTWLDRARGWDKLDIEAFERRQNLLDRLWMDYRLPPQVGYDYVLRGHKLRLRHPVVTIFVGALGEGDSLVPVETHVSTQIYSSRVRGKDIADTLIRGYATKGRGEPRERDDEMAATVDMTINLVAADEASSIARMVIAEGGYWWDIDSGLERGYIDPPHLVVKVGLPLPSARTIASIYDEECIRRRKWHHRVAQIVEQDPRTAMRAWTIALLMATGLDREMSFFRWQELTDEWEDIDPSQLKKEKNQLLARVPEASKFLTLRRRGVF